MDNILFVYFDHVVIVMFGVFVCSISEDYGSQQPYQLAALCLNCSNLSTIIINRRNISSASLNYKHFSDLLCNCFNLNVYWMGLRVANWIHSTRSIDAILVCTALINQWVFIGCFITYTNNDVFNRSREWMLCTWKSKMLLTQMTDSYVNEYWSICSYH